MSRILRRMRRRFDDDRGSLPMAMMVVLVGTLLAALMMPLLLDMRTTTNYNVTRVRDLDAAQAGADVLIGKIRNATGTNGGDPSKLPCTKNARGSANAALKGQVSDGDGHDIARYDVTVEYYLSNPVRFSEADLTAKAMRCVPGAGPYDATTNSVVPSFSRIVSIGTDASTNVAGGTKGRTLVSTYALNVDNSNISGGFIKIYPSSSDTGTWCLDVGSGTPTAGVSQVSLQPCADTYPDTTAQTFAYRPDLTLQLTSSVGTTVAGVTYRTGLCVDIKNFASGSSAPAASSPLVLQQCGTVGSPVWSQQWSFDNYSSLQAPTSSTKSTGTLSGLCMSATDHSIGRAVLLTSCSDANDIAPITDPKYAWLPSPDVGAGAAVSDPDLTDSSIQYINLEQFGRCINNPGDDATKGFVIVASCKQNPRRASVPTNQFFTYKTSTKQLITVSKGSSYCLQSAGTTLSGSPGVRIVALKACSTSLATQRWARTTLTTNPDTPYSQQYRFVDSIGNCMSLGTSTVAGDSQYNTWAKLITDTCDGSTRQQWNAPNNVQDSSVQDVSER